MFETPRAPTKRTVIAAIAAFLLMGAGAAAQQCNFKCVCADSSASMVACPNLNAEQCTQAAQRASIGGVVCTGSMGMTCQASNHIPAPPGSYAQSCSGCQHDCTFLLCLCREPDGTTNQSGIRYAACPGQSVANVDGKLQCGR